jgi:hypothetical protein
MDGVRNMLLFSMGLCGCARTPVAVELLGDLKSSSERSGLALTASTRNEALVLTFDGKRRFYTSERNYLMGNTALTVGWISVIDREHASFRIESNSGRMISTVQVSGLPIALDDKTSRVAFVGLASQPGTAVGAWKLGWVDAQRDPEKLQKTSQWITTLRSMPEGCDWSPSGKMLVCGLGGYISLVNPEAGVVRPLVAGAYPKWNPDGTRISYRSTNGRASVCDSNGVIQQWLFGSRSVSGPIQWSPNGRYVMFVEPTIFALPFLTPYGRVVIGRVSDGESVAVWNLGAGSPEEKAFEWISDYRSFCSACPIGTPFN